MSKEVIWWNIPQVEDVSYETGKSINDLQKEYEQALKGKVQNE